MSSNSDVSAIEKGQPPRRAGIAGWIKQHKWVSVSIVALIVALGIGLGVGLGVGWMDHRDSSNSGSDDNPSSNPSSLPSSSGTTNHTGVWKPQVGATWNYDLLQPLSISSAGNYSIWDIDLFNNDASTIQGLQANGVHVICYFSAGTYENWRPDIANFSASDLGKTLDGWPNEKWLNLSSPTVRNAMLWRLDMAVQKSCDGVDPDNIDGYENDNGLDLTQADAVNYLQFLSSATQARNLSIGLKNGGAIILDVIELMDWSVNEQCVQFQECETYQPFIQAGKPVFHVEYPKGTDTSNNDSVSADAMDKFCHGDNTSGFSTLIKNIDLDLWTEQC